MKPRDKTDTFCINLIKNAPLVACCGHKAQCLSLYLPLSLSLCLSPGLPLLFFIFLFLTGRSQNLPYPRVSSHNFGLETSVLRDAEGSRRNPKQIGWGLFFSWVGWGLGLGGLGLLSCLKPSLESTACGLQDPSGLEPTAPAWMSLLGCVPLFLGISGLKYTFVCVF